MQTGSSRPQPSSIALPANQLRGRLRAGFPLVTSLVNFFLWCLVCRALCGRFIEAQPDVRKDEDQRPADICLEPHSSLSAFSLSCPLRCFRSRVIMALGTQLMLLLWKNYTYRRRQPVTPGVCRSGGGRWQVSITAPQSLLPILSPDPTTSGVALAPLPLLHPSGCPSLPPPSGASRM
jgi:hypothetical protein